MAVVVPGIIGGVGDNGPEAETQGKENLCGRLPPHLHVTPNLQLKRTEGTAGASGKYAHVLHFYKLNQKCHLQLPWDRTCSGFPLRLHPAGVLGQGSRTEPHRGRWRKSTSPKKQGRHIRLTSTYKHYQYSQYMSAIWFCTPRCFRVKGAARCTAAYYLFTELHKFHLVLFLLATCASVRT